MRLESLIERADQLIKLADAILAGAKRDSYGTVETDTEQFSQLRTASLSFLERVFGREHPYYKEFDSKVDGWEGTYTQRGKGILLAARDEMAGGWLNTAKGLISAEIFADFLEMAEHLLEEGYKDPAAVVAGSVLEEHLRQLCQKNGIAVDHVKDGRTVPKRADTLNADLAKADIYNKLDQKNATAWLDLRNKAAHGKYGEYTKEQVALMLQGISDFMARVSV